MWRARVEPPRRAQVGTGPPVAVMPNSLQIGSSGRSLLLTPDNPNP